MFTFDPAFEENFFIFCSVLVVDCAGSMYNWSLWLSLAVICYSSVQSQSCYRGSQCNSGKCCRGTRKCAKEFSSRCECQYNFDCKTNEECRDGFCLPPLRTFNFPTFRPYTFKPPTGDDCFSDSDCSGSRTCVGGRCWYYSDKCVWDSDCTTNNCEDGKCVEYNSGNGGAFSWSGSRVLGIVLFVVVASIVSCLYHVCKRSRRQAMPAVRNGNVSAPPTGITVRTNEHELRPETAATNALAVEVEDDCPLPPNAPPPYNSLQFESQQNGDVNDFPDQLPPSYDEAVKNSGMPPV